MVFDNMFLHIQFAGNVLHEQFRQSLRVNKTNRHLLVNKMHIYLCICDHWVRFVVNSCSICSLTLFKIFRKVIHASGIQLTFP
jgi:hypothetical protein